MNGGAKGEKKRMGIEHLLKASSEVRKEAGLPANAPVRLEDLKAAYFKQRPPASESASPSRKRRETKTAPSTPVTAPDKPVAELDVEARIREFKKGRKR